MPSVKNKIALFLGAGASAPFDKPTTIKIKDDLKVKYKRLSDKNGLGTPSGVLYSFLVNPEFQDIEDVLQSIKEWENFVSTQQYAARFMRGHRVTLRLVVDGRETNFDIDSLIVRIREARRLIEDEVFSAYRWDHDKDQNLQNIYEPLLKIIAGFSSNEVHIFTTNYDRAIETFCINNRKEFQFIDGFAYDAETGYSLWSGGKYDELATSTQSKIKTFLYKIHGSLDWKRHKKYGVVRTGEESRSADPNYDQSIVIFPTVSPKEDAIQEPYASILKRMSQFAKDVDCIIVIGYSFRDDNINEVFKTMVFQKKQLIVISPSGKKNFDSGIVDTSKMDDEVRTRIQFIEKRVEPDNIMTLLMEMRPYLLK